MSEKKPDGLIVHRRTLLVAAGLAGAALGVPLVRRWMRPRAAVFVAKNQRYDGDLVDTIRRGLAEVGFAHAKLRGKKVLLKPNMVEPHHSQPHMTTHPAMILAAAEVFRGWGAEVAVGEGPGHVRDTEMALVESRVQDALDTGKLPFADLNYDEVAFTKNAGGASTLDGFYFPRAVVDSDLVVSMPKLKTHHWIGVTCAMKNLYGVIPGIRYGWPKNVLHFNGIPQTVFDINASLPKTIAIVDGIDCMEGDGPIMGSVKHMGLVLVGQNPAAVDATACRIMGVAPETIGYLQLAANRLGPIDDGLIHQRGEPWQPLVDPFHIIDTPKLEHIRRGRPQRAT